MEHNYEEVNLSAKPEDVGYFELDSELELFPSYRAKADVYIKSSDIQHLRDYEARKYIKENYGSHIGVVYDSVGLLTSKSMSSQMLVLGVVNRKEGV